MISELTPRARQILKLVIEEYVRTARAVGSEVLREKYNLSYSPATLRNEMAELERLGYLTHLHTSSGRVPSERGYRLFVESLMDHFGISAADMRRVEHQFHQVEGNPDLTRWAELAASVLAQLARNATLVTTPQTPSVTLKQVQLIHLYERSALIVAVLTDGSVRQSMVLLPYQATQEELGSISSALTHELRGLTPAEMSRRARQLEPRAAELATYVIGVLGQPQGRATISQSGLLDMLSQPEFREGDAARPVVEVLEGGELITELSRRVANRPGVHVIIGSENPLREMSDCSIVTAAYRSRWGGYGLLTVVGPVRMHYERTISSVYYLSNLMSRMLNP